MPKLNLLCDYCGEPIQKFRCRVMKRNYCSASCHHKDMITKTEVVCAVCEKTFLAVPFFIKRGDAKYCSNECRYVALSKDRVGKGNPRWKQKVKVLCQHCGVEFEVNPSAKKFGHGKYCSQSCAWVHHSQIYRREKHWLWKGGQPIDYGPDWSSIAKTIRKRDNWACRVCNKQIKSSFLLRALHIHHIKPLRSFNGDYNSANHPDNLLCLCSNCHKKVETGKIKLF